MLKSLRNVPRESRVMVVVSLTVLLQVLLLSVFGLASLKGQEAESERDVRELCRRVLSTNLVDEVSRRIERAEREAATAIGSLGVFDPQQDPSLGRAIRSAFGRGTLFERAFILGDDGAWYDGHQRKVWPSLVERSVRVGGASVARFEEVEDRVDGGLATEEALAEVRMLLETSEQSARPYGRLLLARLYRRAGLLPEALKAYDTVCRLYPTALDTLRVPPVPVGPEAAQSRADIRLKLLKLSVVKPAALVDDLVDLRRMLLLNRFQMEERRVEWELARLKRTAEEAARLLEPLERSELADRLAETAEVEAALLVIRRVFGEELERIARGDREGGRLTELLPDGPRILHVVPFHDLDGGPKGAAALQLDLTGMRKELLPPLVKLLPLPDGVAASVLDAEGKPVVLGLPAVRGAVLAESRLGEILPFFRAVVFLEDPGFAERRTRSARRLHYGVMGLSIAGILAAGWFVVRTVRRELKVAKLQSDFLSNVTHELKTPLTSIRMFVETLLDGRVTDEAERNECLSVISREADRLTGLIQRVLDLARLERKRDAGLKREAMDLQSLVDDTAEIFRLRMGDSDASLDVEVAEGLAPVMVDAGAIQEMILNLLSNSLKYGGKRIRLRAEARDGVAVIEVEDDGIGISDEDQKRIFEKFYRADDTLARQVEGSGLGLALVREIARAHGGRIRVKSKKGEGSSFTVKLPVR